MKRNELVVLAGILVILGSLVLLNGHQPFNATAAVVLTGTSESFEHGNPTATIAQSRGNPSFGQLQPIEPVVIGPSQTICQSKASVMFLGVILANDKKTAQQLAQQVTIELYLDSTLQSSTTGKVEKFVDATDPSTSWYQFIEFIFYQSNSLSFGAHTASTIIKFNSVPIFSGSDTFTVLNC